VTPYVNRLQPPTPEELENRQAELNKLRAEQQAQRAAAEPALRAALAAGPELRDLEAAVACSCSCHPRPASPTTHQGGVDCPCQQTLEQRTVGLDALRIIWGKLDATSDEHAQTWQAARDEAAERLGVDIRSIGGMAPFVISGIVDGRGFYLRERHDTWRVEIAPDQNPLDDPWTAPPDQPSITVATGDITALERDGRFDELHALDVAVDAVRTFLTRRSCPHPDARRYCPDCGVELTRAAAWQITTFDDPAAPDT
jgi:hypothetical protein